MRISRYPMVVGISLLVAGYTPFADSFSAYKRACITPSEDVTSINWDMARKIDLRIRQGTFTPTYIGLAQGTPYRLMIENADDNTQIFRAINFFRSIKVADVRVISGPGAGGAGGYSCSGAITIAPGAITEARFVSARDGVYEFYNGSVLMSFMQTGGASGFIVIEPKRRIPDSPVKHLKLLERKPLVTAPVSASSGGLFDDEPVEQQPVQAAPAVPVEELPVEEIPQVKKPTADLFSD